MCKLLYSEFIISDIAFKPMLSHASCVFDIAGFVKSVKVIGDTEYESLTPSRVW